jgi:hypothetical protein
MTVKINNRLPVYETALLSAIVIFTFGGALYYILQIQGVDTVVSTIVSVIISLIIIAFTLWRRGQKRGKLVIDTEKKQFSLNNSEFQPYSNIKRYKSTLRSTTMRVGMSTMYVRISDGKNGGFDIHDVDRFYFLPKGRTLEEISSLEELVNGSSLTDEEKASFNNWVERARLLH